MRHTELMYDATPPGVDKIPANAPVVAGYVDGHYVSFPALVKRFPHAAHVSIGVFLGHTAEFSDIEPGNPINTPDLIRKDFQYRKREGVWKPGFYADATRMAETVLPGLTGIPRSEYRLWLADWDGNPHNLPQFDAAKQYKSTEYYDVSVVDPASMFPAPNPIHKPIVHHHHPTPKPPKPPRKPIHPKVVGSTVAGITVTTIEAILHVAGIAHLTPAEYSGITTFAAALAGYIVPANNLGGGQ